MKISKFTVFLLLFTGLLVVSFGNNAAAITINDTYNETGWETAAGVFQTEDFSGYNVAGQSDTVIANYSDSFAVTDTGKIKIQDLGDVITGGNVIDEPTFGVGGAANDKNVDGTTYLRGAVRGKPGDNHRLRIFFDTPINFFAADFNAFTGAGLEVRIDDASTPSSFGAPLIDITVTPDATGFFGFESDEAFDTLFFQVEGYNPAQDTGGTGFGVDNIRWAAAQVPEPATMLLLGIGLIGLAGISRRRLRK